MSGLNQDALKMSAKAADASPATSEVGTLLCATRMRLGRDLQHIAKILHIRYNYLVAMEDGRYEDLPGQAYAIGFVRAYADHLGLDGDEIVRRYKEETSGLKNRPVFEFPLTPPDSHFCRKRQCAPNPEWFITSPTRKRGLHFRQRFALACASGSLLKT